MSEDAIKTAKNRVKALLEALQWCMPQKDFKELALELVQYELKAIP